MRRRNYNHSIPHSHIGSSGGIIGGGGIGDGGGFVSVVRRWISRILGPSNQHHHRIQTLLLSVPPCIRYGCIGLISLIGVTIIVIFISTISGVGGGGFFSHRFSPTQLQQQQQHYDDRERLFGRLRQRLVGTGGSSSTTETLDHRIAIIIPFIGKDVNAIPSYLELFCTAAAGSSSLVDFLLIHDGVLDDVVDHNHDNNNNDDDDFQQQDHDVEEEEEDGDEGKEKEGSSNQEDDPKRDSEKTGNERGRETGKKNRNLEDHKQPSHTKKRSSSSSICPSNVLFLSLGDTERFARALVKVLDRKPDNELAKFGKSSTKSSGGESKEQQQQPTSRFTIARILAQHILKYPYVLVEFKPALGHIFQSFLDGYTHWGYSDMDIVFGDLERWITPDELTDFDIVTYGFGDQNRIYLRGQFTFHRNDPNHINQLWRRCSYLSHMDQRFAQVLSGEKSLHFESAEGCYSAAVLEDNDVRIKYAVKAFTDVDGKDTTHSHGLYVGTGKRKDRTVLYKAGTENPLGLADTSQDWFEAKGSVYANTKNLLYRDVGERERIPVVEKNDVKCMFWAQKQYQSRLCLDDVSSTDTVYWIKGQLYKQKYELTTLPNSIVTAPFFHFQEWKRYYRSGQLGGFHRSGPSTTFVLSKEGVFPILPIKEKRSMFLPLPGRRERHVISSPLGMKNLHQWNGVLNEGRAQLPRNHYCLKSVPRQHPPLAPECKYKTSWRDEEVVEILSGAPSWSEADAEHEVTLALTLQIHPEQVDDAGSIQGLLNLLTIYLDRWQGQPCVIVIHVAGATPALASMFRNKLSTGSELSYYGFKSCLIAAIFSTQPDTMSRKALLNMAMDAAPTRWILSGYELERGVVMSQDTAYLVHRTAYVHKETYGSIHIIPQFGVARGEHDFTIPSLELAYLDGDLRSLAKLEEGFCDGDDTPLQNEEQGVFGEIEKVWWRSTRQLTNDGSSQKADADTIEKQAEELEVLQNSVVALLTEEHHYSLYTTDVSPIFLFDNRGPRPGIVATQMAREVEEFGGRLCYNSIRLAQMAALGFRVNVLAGAFAVSTPATRHIIGDQESAATGASRCDGCFFFSEDQNDEEILEGVSLDERKRPAKIAVLWDQSDSVTPR